jgi:hypothetical protein
MFTIKEQRYERNYLSFSQGKDFVTSVPGNGAKKDVVPESVLRLKVQCQGIRKYGNG